MAQPGPPPSARRSATRVATLSRAMRYSGRTSTTHTVQPTGGRPHPFEDAGRDSEGFSKRMGSPLSRRSR
jgi:hypothetical protein